MTETPINVKLVVGAAGHKLVLSAHGKKLESSVCDGGALTFLTNGNGVQFDQTALFVFLMDCHKADLALDAASGAGN